MSASVYFYHQFVFWGEVFYPFIVFSPIFLLSCSVLYIFSYNCLNSAFIGTELTSWLPSSVTILEICQANNWLVLFQDS